MSLFTAQLYPGRALGFLVLGATLHDVLTRLKAEPQRFPKIELLYSSDRPVTEPVGVELPGNGIRLRFDGPEQRLRLIEITDFTKNHITFKERDLVKPFAGTPGSPSPGDSASGPTFRHIYHKLLGPTYAGEFIPPSSGHDNGIYVLSYPGVAFNFALNPSEYSPEKDVVSTFASASSQVATSMAVFSGDSWADARPTLWTEILPSIKSTTVIPRGKDVYPDEISLVRLHGAGKIQLFRKWTSNSFWITLGKTTPQDLLMELGPPNAIYRKNDQKMVIHKTRTASNAKGRPDAADIGRPEDLTDTDQSSMHEGSDASDNEEAVDDQIGLNTNGECFYNYFYLGFDILISTRVPPSQAPPGSKVGEAEGQNGIISHSPDRLVATKLVLHGNIPGSYEFNRHRRCRWEIAYLDSLNDDNGPTDSETPFPQIEDRMNAAWASAFPRNDSQQRQRGMVLNRGWGDSPGSSCEFLGGWEESGARRAETNGDSTTTLYGFPGHSCEHGEYDAQNCKRTLSILPRLSDTLKRRRRLPYSAADTVNGNGPLSPLCKRNCYRSSPRPVAASIQRPWDEEDHFILRSTVATADRSKVTKDPFCLVAQLLDRDCSDVFNEYQKLNVSMSPVEPANRLQIRTVSWYDRFKKTLIGDWESHTKTHEHQKRELSEPCNHEGPCTSESCICVQHGVLCEKFCGCTVENCAYKFTGCACHSQGKTCLSKGKERPCICVQLNRECDPDVCGRCGVVERADPENADNEVLHSTGCQNCSLQRGQAKSLALGESQLEGVGYGLFTIEDIAQDDFIIEYVGELITHDEGVRREARRGDVFDEESNISYVFTLLDNEGIWVDAATYGNLSRYINHASESDKRGCNITPRILYVNGEYRIKFTAMRDIKAGEELFFNYGENFPNLTKKLLDHKVGGKSDQGKKRSRRPNGEGVARKNPKTDKKKPGKGKKRAQAVLDEDDMLADTLGFAPKPLRKRKKGPFEEDSEEEEYHPTGTDASIMETPSDGDSDFGNSAARLRKRARQDGKGAASSHNGKPRGDLKTRGKRGGARPGSGRPRKYPRKLTSAPMLEHPSASESQDREDPEERQIVAADTIVPAALQRPQPVEINDSMEYITFSEERTEESRLLQSQLEEDNDEDDDDDDQDVVVRSRVDRGVRNRRPTAKLRDDGDWISGSQ